MEIFNFSKTAYFFLLAKVGVEVNEKAEYTCGACGATPDFVRWEVKFAILSIPSVTAYTWNFDTIPNINVESWNYKIIMCERVE